MFSGGGSVALITKLVPRCCGILQSLLSKMPAADSRVFMNFVAVVRLRIRRDVFMGSRSQEVDPLLLVVLLSRNCMVSAFPMPSGNVLVVKEG